MELARQALGRFPADSPQRQGIGEAAELLGQLVLQNVELGEDGPVLKDGASRDRIPSVHDPEMREDLDRLVEPASRGDPESPLRWICKSVRQLAAELKRQGHQASHRMVAELLQEMGYSLQANRKTLEGTEHPDGNAQFEHLNHAVQLLELPVPVSS